jgi:hypothetical protein
MGYTLIPFALAAPDELGAKFAPAPNVTALIITMTMMAAHVVLKPRLQETR